MDDNQKAAFDAARDTTKQFITLSTGMIAAEIAFLKNIVELNLNGNITLIFVSWLSFLLSIFFGVWVLMALTGSISSKGRDEDITIYSPSVRFPCMFQIMAFLGGLLLTVIYGFSIG